MRIAIYFLTIFLIGSYAVSGQAEKSNQISISNYMQNAQQETGSLKNRLELSPLQSDSILEINKTYYYKIAGLKDLNFSTSRRDTLLSSIQFEKEARIRNVLSEIQLKQYLDYSESVRLKILERQNLKKTENR